MSEELLAFLRAEECFIEAEGKPSSLNGFIESYNRDFDMRLSIHDNGIICLDEDANKWGLELRLYVKTCPPPDVKAIGFTRNIHYRDDYTYRLNDNQIIRELFNNGYRIGLNRV